MAYDCGKRRRTRYKCCEKTSRTSHSSFLVTLTTSCVLLLMLHCASQAEGSITSWFPSLAISSLGPEPQDVSTCTEDDSDCSTKAPEVDNGGHGGFVPPGQGVDPSSHIGGNLEEIWSDSVSPDDSEEPEPHFDLVEKESVPSSMLSKVGGSVTNVFSSASGYFSRKIYDKASNITQDFADKVRDVFHEELYKFFEASLKKVWDLLQNPGMHTDANTHS